MADPLRKTAPMGTTDETAWWKHAHGLPPALVRWQERRRDHPKRVDGPLLFVLAMIGWQVANLASPDGGHRPLRVALAVFGAGVVVAALVLKRLARHR